MNRKHLRILLAMAGAGCALICIGLALLLTYEWLARGSYEEQRYIESSALYQKTLHANILERDKAYFNAGTSLARTGVEENLKRAQDHLTKALAMAPKKRECKVRLNLLLTMEARILREEDESQRQEIHKEATKVIKDQPRCFDDKSATDKTTRKDLLTVKKRLEAMAKGSEQKEEPKEDEQSRKNPPESSGQEEQVRQGMQEAQAYRQSETADTQRSDEYDRDIDPATRTW